MRIAYAGVPRSLPPIVGAAGLLGLLLLTGLAGCLRQGRDAHEPALLAAVIDCDPSRSVEWSSTPGIVIYENGRFIVRRDASGRGEQELLTGELTLEERAEINRLIAGVVRVAAGGPPWSVPGQPAPGTWLVFGGSSRVLQVYAMVEDVGATELKPEVLAWLTYVADLCATKRDLAPWSPDAIHVRLTRMRGSDRAVNWPAAWPAPVADKAASKVRCEVLAPVRSAAEFWTALGTRGQARPIAYRGKSWRAEVWPMLPGSAAWNNLIAPSADEPSASDLVVWSEAASLIAQAERVWIRTEDGTDRGTAWADRDWIRRFSTAIERAPLEPGQPCFCIASRTAVFERAGRPLIWVSTLHGVRLRIYLEGGRGGGDYSVDRSTWDEINALLETAARDGIGRPPLVPAAWTPARPRPVR